MLLTILASILLASPVVLEVPGLTCPTCVKPVRRALALVDGVERIEVDWRSRRVTVAIDTEKVDEARLRTILSKAGFPAKGSTPPVKQAPAGDFLLVDETPPNPDALAVWGKATVVGVCTPKCAPCVNLKKDLQLFSNRVRRVAVRIVVVDGPDHPAASYLPSGADIPYVYIYDQKAKRTFAGGAGGDRLYQQIEKILGVVKR